MREIRTSGSEGGVELILHSYPYPFVIEITYPQKSPNRFRLRLLNGNST